MENEMLKMALGYLKRSSILPVARNKQPLVAWKEFQTRKPTEEEVKEWFKKFPDMNIGIVTGKISDFIVVDVEKGGDVSDLPDTLISKTGGGGWHYYYRYTEGITNKARIRKLTDIRAESGFVVAPPSVHASGVKYEWVNRNMPAIFPKYLFGFKNTEDWVEISNGVSEGQRNETASKYIGKLMNVFPPNTWESTVWETAKIWNSKNVPSLPERELRTVYNSISNRAIKNNRKIEQGEKEIVNFVPFTKVLQDGINTLLTTREEDIVSFGYDWLDDKLTGLFPGELVVIGGESGTGKCLGRGTQILMFNGTTKKVEDIKIGDKIMGDDSKSRNVLSLARGKEMMYKIIPKKGNIYRVNESHIISLKCTNSKKSRKYNCGYLNLGNKKIDISIKNYLKKTKTWKRVMKGYRVEVKFKKQKEQLIIDPYFLGLWLGDGTSASVNITSMDGEIISFLQDYAKQLNLTCHIDNLPDNRAKTIRITIGRRGRSKDSLQKRLREIEVIKNKHIPLQYLTSSVKNRLKLLAGLIDSDGHLDGNIYDIILTNERLLDDIIFLARSLGFSAYKKQCIKSISSYGYQCNAFRTCISGNCDKIPVKILRKKAGKRRQIKDVLRTGIKIEKDKVDNYYGFEINGNGRFLLGDFTVTHNTTVSTNIIYKASERRKCVVFALEDRLDDYAIKRLYFEIGKIRHERGQKNYKWNDYRKNIIPREQIQEELNRATESLKNNNVYFADVKQQMNINLLEELIEEQVNNGVSLFLIDHLHYFDLLRGNANKSDYIELLMVRLKTLLNRTGARVILVVHYKKLDGKKPRLDSFKDSIAIVQNANYVINIWRERDNVNEDNKYKTTFYIPKSRNPNGEGIIEVEFNPETNDYKSYMGWQLVDLPKEKSNTSFDNY